MWVISQYQTKGIPLNKFYSTVAASMEHVFKQVHCYLLLSLLRRSGGEEEEEGGSNSKPEAYRCMHNIRKMYSGKKKNRAIHRRHRDASFSNSQ